MTKPTPNLSDPREHLSEEDLNLFNRGMRKFNEFFCSFMFAQSEATVKLEVRVNGGKLVYCRTYTDDLEKPKNPRKK